jgi:hypothetical protein
MRKISLIGIAAFIMLGVFAAWASSSHSAVKVASRPPQIDPLSLMANAKKAIGQVAAQRVIERDPIGS